VSKKKMASPRFLVELAFCRKACSSSRLGAMPLSSISSSMSRAAESLAGGAALSAVSDP